MAISSFNVPFLAFLFCFVAVLSKTLSSETAFSFSFNSFGKNASDIGLDGDAESVAWINPSSNSTYAKLVYRKPIKFLGRNPGFSSYFRFSFSPGIGNEGSLQFWLSPVSLMKGISGGFVSHSVLSVEFNSSAKNRVAVNIADRVYVESSNLSTVLNNREKLSCWVDYDSKFKKLEVRLGNSSSLSRPSSPVISYPNDLSSLLQRTPMLVGITSSSKNFGTIRVYSWSFGTKHGAPYEMHSDPLDPRSFPSFPNERPPVQVMRRGYPWIIVVALVFGAACGAMVAFYLTIICSLVVDSRPVAPVEYHVHAVDLVCDKGYTGHGRERC